MDTHLCRKLFSVEHNYLFIQMAIFAWKGLPTNLNRKTNTDAINTWMCSLYIFVVNAKWSERQIEEFFCVI